MGRKRKMSLGDVEQECDGCKWYVKRQMEVLNNKAGQNQVN